MTVAPPASPALRDVRAAASRQARRLSGGLAAALGVGLALLIVAALAVLDYAFGPTPKLLAKILLGTCGVATLLLWQRLGLFLLPLAIPYLAWMPKLPLPGLNAVNLLLFLVFVPWAVARVMRREPVFRSGELTRPFAALLVVAVLSIVHGAAMPPASHPFPVGWAFLELFRSATTVTLYFIALAMVDGSRDRRMLGWLVVLGLAAESVTTLMLGRNGSGDRALGSFGQANELGAFLAMFAVFAAALLGASRRWPARLALTGVLSLGALAQFLTVSRAGVIALAAGLLFVALRSSRAMAFLVVGALVSAPFWMPADLKERLATTQVEVEGTDEVELERAAESRVQTWQSVMSIVAEHPIDGVGFATLTDVLPAKGEELGFTLVARSAHNTFLRMLAETGILGLLALVWVFWSCMRLSLRGARRAASRHDRQLAVGLGGAAIALAVSCFFGDRFFNMLITGNFWLACALVDDAARRRPDGA